MCFYGFYDFKNGSGPCMHGTQDEVWTTKQLVALVLAVAGLLVVGFVLVSAILN